MSVPNEILSIGQGFENGADNFELRQTLGRAFSPGSVTRERDLQEVERILTRNGVEAAPVMKNISEALHRARVTLMQPESGYGF